MSWEPDSAFPLGQGSAAYNQIRSEAADDFGCLLDIPEIYGGTSHLGRIPQLDSGKQRKIGALPKIVQVSPTDKKGTMARQTNQ